MSEKSLDVALVGELYVDHVFDGFERWPKPGEEVVTDRYLREIGGGAANTACGLARLGRAVAVLGRVGELDASWFRRRLEAFGVNADDLCTVAGQTGVTVSVSTREDRSFFTHVGVNADLGATLLTRANIEAMTRAHHVHFAMPLTRDVADSLLPRLAAAACTTSLDVGHQPAWLGDSANHSTLRAFDHLLPNALEGALLSGAQGADAFFAYVARLDLREATLKLGAAGAEGVGLDGKRFTATPPRVVATDTTGAGDAFDAGFIDALLDGADPRERLRRACIVGAMCTRVAGALNGLPDLAELRSHYADSDRT